MSSVEEWIIQAAREGMRDPYDNRKMPQTPPSPVDEPKRDEPFGASPEDEVDDFVKAYMLCFSPLYEPGLTNDEGAE